MRRVLILLCFIIFYSNLFGQQTENIFIITLDGLRWHELFYGADSLLIDDSGYVENPGALTDAFWYTDPKERRVLLMPFFWNVIAKEGQIYGNRKYGNNVDCTNKMLFSFPGYNELLTGAADDERINSNDKIPNPNINVLEFLNKQPNLKGKVAAFGSWDVFPYIINTDRSGVYVNAGFEKVTQEPLTEKEMLLNEMLSQIRSPWDSVRLDPFTHHYAMEFIKKNNPRVMYIAYGETDDFAHDGRYDQYLYAARMTDDLIRELWEYTHQHEQYKNKTTFLIATDHGRGTLPKSEWKSHGAKINGAEEVWLAVIGPDTPADGEIKTNGQLFQNQVAATAAAFLGFDFISGSSHGQAIKLAFQR
jgi:hypothetical protein